MRAVEEFFDELLSGRAGAGLIVGAVGLSLVVFFQRLLARIAPRRRIRLTVGMYLLYFSIAVVLAFVSREAHPTLRRYLSVIGLLALALAVVRTISLIAVDYFVQGRRKLRVPVIIRDIVFAALFLILGFIILGEHGVDLSGLVTTSAVLTAVLGLALQDVLSNVFAGLAVQFERAFDVGDWVKFGNFVGEVREIGWRTVKIVNNANEQIILPNNYVAKETVVNYSRPTPVRRRSVRVGVHYRFPPGQVKDAILAAARDVPGVLERPAPDVLTEQYAESAVTYCLRFWISDFARREVIEEEVLSRIWYRLARAGMEIPFPIRTLRIASEVEEVPDIAARTALLRGADFLAPFSDRDLGMLAEAGKEVRFARGEVIVREGEEGRSCFAILEGEVEVRVGGRTVSTIGTGGFFGELSVFTGEPRAATVVALRESRLLRVDDDVIRAILAREPDLMPRISEILAMRQFQREPAPAATEPERAEAVRVESESLLQRIRRFLGVGPR